MIPAHVEVAKNISIVADRKDKTESSYGKEFTHRRITDKIKNN